MAKAAAMRKFRLTDTWKSLNSCAIFGRREVGGDGGGGGGDGGGTGSSGSSSSNSVPHTPVLSKTKIC